MKITELENRKQFKCVLLLNRMKEEKEVLLHPDKSGTVQDLLDEGRKHITELDPSASNQLR